MRLFFQKKILCWQKREPGFGTLFVSCHPWPRLTQSKLLELTKLTEIGQQSEKFVLKDGAIFILVVKLEDFNEIVEATGVLGVLGFLEEGVEVVDLEGLLALLGLTSQLGDGLEGGVQVAGAQQVTDVESVDLAVSLEVIDLKGKLDPQNYKLLFVKYTKE